MKSKARRPEQFVDLERFGPVVETAGCWHFKTDYQVWYRNPEHGLVLVEHGDVEAHTTRGVVRGTDGDLLYYPPAARMSYRVQGPAILYLSGMLFTPPPSHLHIPCLPGGIPMPAKVSLGTAFSEVRSLMETLCIEVPRAGGEHRLRVQATVHQILAVIVRLAKPNPASRTRMDAWERARVRLDSPGGYELRIADLARDANVSTRYFQREFRRRFQASPKSYQLRSRVGEAVRRLRERDASFKAIAYEMGFRDPKILARAIRRQLGVGPAQLRLTVATGARPLAPKHTKPFVLNRYAVPPGTPSNWIDRYEPIEAIGELPQRE